MTSLIGLSPVIQIDQDPAAPFGGVKQSGLSREGGFDGIHEFLQTKFTGVEI